MVEMRSAFDKRSVLDTLLIAPQDKDMMEPIAKLRLQAVATDIFMTSSSDKRRLARQVLAVAGK